MTPGDHARVAYDAFAPYYDEFTAHHDYEAWTATLERRARDAGLRGREFLDDSVNYLHEATELEAAFAGIARNLAPGGVLVFDANTLATFRRLYSSCLVVQSPGRVLTLRGRGSPRLSAGGGGRPPPPPP